MFLLHVYVAPRGSVVGNAQLLLQHTIDRAHKAVPPTGVLHDPKGAKLEKQRVTFVLVLITPSVATRPLAIYNQATSLCYLPRDVVSVSPDLVRCLRPRAKPTHVQRQGHS